MSSSKPPSCIPHAVYLSRVNTGGHPSSYSPVRPSLIYQTVRCRRYASSPSPFDWLHRISWNMISQDIMEHDILWSQSDGEGEEGNSDDNAMAMSMAKAKVMSEFRPGLTAELSGEWQPHTVHHPCLWLKKLSILLLFRKALKKATNTRRIHGEEVSVFILSN